MLTSKFRPKVAPPHINIKISPNAALPRLITKFKIAYERSETLLNFSPCSTLHLTFSTSKRLAFTKPTSTRRTSGRCLGTFVAANLNLCPPLPLKVVPIATPPHFLFSLSLLRLQRVKTQSVSPLILLIPNSWSSSPRIQRYITQRY
jgi:hypothetical protein